MAAPSMAGRWAERIAATAPTESIVEKVGRCEGIPDR